MIIVSACLLGENCKYSGGNNMNFKIIEYLKDKKYIKICPEVMGGLSTPRHQAEILGNKVVTIKGADVTAQFFLGATKAFELAKKHKVTLAILKSKSPSCGLGYIYDGNFCGKLIQGNGITAELFIKNNIKVINENELNKL